MRYRVGWLCVALALGACGGSRAARRSEQVDASGLSFKSSPAVLLEHRAELALTPVQVERFEQLDFALHEKNLVLQRQVDALREKSKKDSKPWHGGYMGGGSHDVHGGKGGTMSGPADADRQKLQRRAGLERTESLLREMQDNDSQTYLQAEALLTPEQTPRARELFSQEREQLLKQLDAMHYQIRKGDY